MLSYAVRVKVPGSYPHGLWVVDPNLPAGGSKVFSDSLAEAWKFTNWTEVYKFVASNFLPDECEIQQIWFGHFSVPIWV